MEAIKKIIIKIIKITFLILLVSTIIQTLLNDLKSSISISEFIDNILRNFNVVNSDGEKSLDIIKILSVISISIFVELEIIEVSAELTKGMNEIIKYHSKNNFNYIINIIKVMKKYILQNIFFWLIVFITVIFISNKVEIKNIKDILAVIEFLILNNLMIVFILINSKNALITIIMYIIKCFLIVIFIKKEFCILLIIICILLINYLFKIKVENKKWKL